MMAEGEKVVVHRRDVIEYAGLIALGVIGVVGALADITWVKWVGCVGFILGMFYLAVTSDRKSTARGGDGAGLGLQGSSGCEGGGGGDGSGG